jgi:hypothetical protein
MVIIFFYFELGVNTIKQLEAGGNPLKETQFFKQSKNYHPQTFMPGEGKTFQWG